MTTCKDKYLRLTPHEHVRLRPSMYVGSTKIVRRMEWVLRDDRLVREECEVQPWIVRLLEYALSKILYASGKDSSVHLNVSVTSSAFTCSIINASNSQVAESACFQLCESTDKQLIEALSTSMTSDRDYISFVPNVGHFGQSAILPGTIQVMQARLLSIVACTKATEIGHIVRFNDAPLEVTSFANYLARYDGAYWTQIEHHPDFQCFMRKRDVSWSNDSHVSHDCDIAIAFVNGGFHTRRGGTHVDRATRSLRQALRQRRVQRTSEPFNQQKDQYDVAVWCRVEHPEFNSQALDCLASPRRSAFSVIQC